MLTDRVLQRDPTNTEALLLRGHVRASLGEFELANDDYKKVLELDPENTLASKIHQYLDGAVAKKDCKKDGDASSIHGILPIPKGALHDGRVEAKADERPDRD